MRGDRPMAIVEEFIRFDSEITLLTADGARGPIAGSKDTLAHDIWDFGLELRSRR